MTIEIRLCHGIGCNARAETDGKLVHAERADSVDSAIGLLLRRLHCADRNGEITITDIAECDGCDECRDDSDWDDYADHLDRMESSDVDDPTIY